jgi:fumarylacetoacetase
MTHHDTTCDPTLRSWVASANHAGTDFPIQNLPFGVFREPRPATARPDVGHVAVAIGDQVLDLGALADAGVLDGLPSAVLAACRQSSLNLLMSLGRGAAQALRRRVSALLEAANTDTIRFRRQVEAALRPQESVQMMKPALVGDYTDFYASIFHATNVGRLFRPDNPLLPNYKYVPIGYHGRASSLVATGVPVRRPLGQVADPLGHAPSFGPTRLLDYEVEVGFFVSEGNRLGEPVPIAAARDHMFGLCLVNDWSARDVQAWEYQPLGPFLSKSFATTLSPWVVTLDALEPFRVPAFVRPLGDPPPLPYLFAQDDQERGGFDITLEALLLTDEMRVDGSEPWLLSRGNLRDLYWTVTQMLAHHTSNGCNLRPADLFASGTVSGPDDSARGCLLEITERGKNPVSLPTGETRSFLEDGDELILRGFCERPGAVRIGFGECRGRILPAAAPAPAC